MTRTFAVDSNNDMYLSASGNISIVDGITATMQAAQQAAQTQLNEMIYATDQGIPNFQAVWNGSPKLLQFEAALRRTLLAVADVTGIRELTVTTANNKLNYTATILTSFGEAAING